MSDPEPVETWTCTICGWVFTGSPDVIQCQNCGAMLRRVTQAADTGEVTAQ